MLPDHARPSNLRAFSTYKALPGGCWPDTCLPVRSTTSTSLVPGSPARAVLRLGPVPWHCCRRLRLQVKGGGLQSLLYSMRSLREMKQGCHARVGQPFQKAASFKGTFPLPPFPESLKDTAFQLFWQGHCLLALLVARNTPAASHRTKVEPS